MPLLSKELEQIRQARSSLQKFRLRLLRPSIAALESGSADLVVALDCMKRLEPALASGVARPKAVDQSLQLEIAALRRDLQQVNALLEGAAKFYEGWARLLSSASDDSVANYTSAGRPQPAVSSETSSMVIHG